MKIIADCDIPYLRGVLEPYAQVVYLKGTSISAADVADADALLVRTRTRCDARLLADSRVGFIGTATIGFDHIDMAYCASRGIKVAPAPGSNARGVLQYVSAVLALLASSRDLIPWRTTLGVVGAGHTGSLIAEYASGWGFTVLRCDPPRARAGEAGFVSFEDLTVKSDIVSFHVPLNMAGEDRTFHMAGDRFFSSLRPDTFIINCSRGEVVDTAALKAALGGPLAGCAIDTWENEPHIDRELVRDALIATPHIAGYTQQGKASAISMVVNALFAHYGFGSPGWYPPEGGNPSQKRPISWDEMLRSMPSHYDIAADSRRLKAGPSRFEELRNGYAYREEYF